MSDIENLLKQERQRLASTIEDLRKDPDVDDELIPIPQRRLQFVEDLMTSADDPNRVLHHCQQWLNNATDKHRRSQARFDTPPETQWWDTMDTLEYVSNLTEQIRTRTQHQDQ